MADNTAESGYLDAREGKQAVVDREDKLADYPYGGVAEEEVKVAIYGAVEGVLSRDDGAVGGTVLESREGILHVNARESLGREEGRGKGHGGGLLAVGAADTLVGYADGTAGVTGGDRWIRLPEKALEAGNGHLEAEK